VDILGFDAFQCQATVFVTIKLRASAAQLQSIK